MCLPMTLRGVRLVYFNDVGLSHLKDWIDIQDKNRPLGHPSKLELIAGDACNTIKVHSRESTDNYFAFVS